MKESIYRYSNSGKHPESVLIKHVLSISVEAAETRVVCVCVHLTNKQITLNTISIVKGIIPSTALPQHALHISVTTSTNHYTKELSSRINNIITSIISHVYHNTTR